MVVSKKIKSCTVVARPIFKDGPLPSFWEAVVNNRTVPRKFASVHEVFMFVERTQSQNRH